ncbi:hypothetical protein C6503_07710 [Candidatus Poribacteria bacterium]|nr:MAG: hypothetical protein C6503_07710 [Candidatus Poribacteria bacterium]
MRSKKLLPFYVLITLLVSGFMGLYIFWKMDPSNQKFAQPPEKLTPIAAFNHESLIHDVAFSPVDTSIVAGTDGNTIKLWHLANTEAPQAILSGHVGTVKSIAFSPTGELLASADLHKQIILWSVPSGTKINSFEATAMAVAISPNGHYLATAYRQLKLWDIRDPKKIVEFQTFPHDETEKLWTVDFSPDGKWLACGDENGKLKVWDLQHQKLTQSLKADSDKILAVQFSEDGNFLASIGLYNHTLWNIPEWKTHGKIMGEAAGLDIAFSANNRTYVTSNLDGAVLRSTVNGERIASIRGATGATWSVAFSPDGRMLAAGGEDEKLRLWNVSEQQLVRIDTTQHDIIRLIYFLSKERPPQRGISTKLDRLIRQTQRFYATEMKNHGFERKTFMFETDARGKAKVFLVMAKHPDAYYEEDTTIKIRKEISERFDYSKNILLVAVDIQSGVFQKKGRFRTVGQVSVNRSAYSKNLKRTLHGGRAFVSASWNTLDWDTIAHELGHTFGLEHDFRGRNRRIMSYASGRYELSKCAAEWLDKSRFFNPNQPFFDKPATIGMHLLPTLPNVTPIQIQFDVTDEDGIHQVQLVVPTTRRDPGTKQGFKLHSCQSLNGVKKATVTFELPKLPVKRIELQMMDLHGNIVWRKFDLSEDSAQPSEEP